MASVPRPRAAASGHDAGRHDPSAVAEAEPAFARVPAFSDAVFRDDAACLAYLKRLRWPNGFICPRCESGRAGSAAVSGSALAAGLRPRSPPGPSSRRLGLPSPRGSQPSGT